MIMRKEFFVLMIIALLLTSAVSIAQDEDYDPEEARQEALEKAERYANQIMKACIANMDSAGCSCDVMPEDIPTGECNKAMSLAKSYVSSIKKACLTDPDSSGCSCDAIPADYQGECESALGRAMTIATNLKEEIEAACYEDPYSSDCSCDEVPDDGRATCEAAISRALNDIEERRAEVVEQCKNELDRCNCENVPTKYRDDCQIEKDNAIALRAEIEARCKRSPEACNCNELEEGQKECKEAKEAAMEESKESIVKIFDECFSDVLNCDCSALFSTHLSSEYYDSIAYCEEQRDFGLNCMRAGFDCDKMDAEKLIPGEVPKFLQPFVKQSLESKIEKEKEKGVKSALKVITTCIDSPEKCDCSETPVYAQEFCEHKKELQIQCNTDDYTACMELDAEPIVPDYLPDFSMGIITKLVQKLKDAQKGIVMARASKKVGNVILACMDGPDDCDCSVAPQGTFRAFCEHKKELIGQCRDDRILDACFTLDQEEVMPPGVPDTIMNHIEKNVMPTIEEKKQAIFEEMRGDQCEGLTLPECKEWCDANTCTI